MFCNGRVVVSSCSGSCYGEIAVTALARRLDLSDLIKDRVCAEVWHETYLLPPGHSESVYVTMPRYGLGLVGSVFPAKRPRATAEAVAGTANGGLRPVIWR
jgi:hypothetical protein